MNLRTAFGTLLGFISIADVAALYTAPSTETKFQPILSRSKLQYPESGLSASSEMLYNGFAKWHFHLLDPEKYLRFQVAGSSRRSELREMEDFGSEVYWAVDDSETHTATASIVIPQQEDGIEEVTVMQVHGSAAPVLRISWVDSIKINSVTYDDIIVSTIRVGLGSSSENFVKTVLGNRSSSPIDYQITVKDSTLTIKVNGSTKVDKQDLSFWKGEDSCYFKAGAYNNHPSELSASARISFSQLSW